MYRFYVGAGNYSNHKDLANQAASCIAVYTGGLTVFEGMGYWMSEDDTLFIEPCMIFEIIVHDIHNYLDRVLGVLFEYFPDEQCIMMYDCKNNEFTTLTPPV